MRHSLIWRNEEQARLEEALRLDAEANAQFAREAAVVSSTVLRLTPDDLSAGPDHGKRPDSTTDPRDPRVV